MAWRRDAGTAACSAASLAEFSLQRLRAFAGLLLHLACSATCGAPRLTVGGTFLSPPTSIASSLRLRLRLRLRLPSLRRFFHAPPASRIQRRHAAAAERKGARPSTPAAHTAELMRRANGSPRAPPAPSGPLTPRR